MGADMDEEAGDPGEAADHLVVGETLVIDGSDHGWPGTSAALQWRVTRRINHRLPRVTTDDNGGPDLGTIAFDLRFELLGEPMACELSRGMEIELLSYQRLTGSDDRLRAVAANHVRDRVLELAYRPPT